MSTTLTTRKCALPFLALFIVLPRLAASQSIKDLIDSQAFVFQAQTAQPLRGPIRQLTTDNYTLKVTKAKIVSDLPYFGQAYVAPADPTEGALEFTLNSFDYQMTPGKKEGWNITIKPKNNKDIQSIQLNVSSAGYTTVQILSTNRDAMTFSGIVTAVAKPGP